MTSLKNEMPLPQRGIAAGAPSKRVGDDASAPQENAKSATRGKPHGPICVDPEDQWLAAGRRWKRSNQGYAVRTLRRAGPQGGSFTTEMLHRVIAGAAEGQQVDHINRDKLDNRRCNLRLCTSAENHRNAIASARPPRSGFRGVTSRRDCFEARICVDGRGVYLGRFSTAKAASEARDAAAKRLHGVFAVLAGDLG